MGFGKLYKLCSEIIAYVYSAKIAPRRQHTSSDKRWN